MLCFERFISEFVRRASEPNDKAECLNKCWIECLLAVKRHASRRFGWVCNTLKRLLPIHREWMIRAGPTERWSRESPDSLIFEHMAPNLVNAAPNAMWSVNHSGITARFCHNGMLDTDIPATHHAHVQLSENAYREWESLLVWKSQFLVDVGVSDLMGEEMKKANQFYVYEFKAYAASLFPTNSHRTHLKKLIKPILCIRNQFPKLTEYALDSLAKRVPQLLQNHALEWLLETPFQYCHSNCFRYVLAYKHPSHLIRYGESLPKWVMYGEPSQPESCPISLRMSPLCFTLQHQQLIEAKLGNSRDVSPYAKNETVFKILQKLHATSPKFLTDLSLLTLEEAPGSTIEDATYALGRKDGPGAMARLALDLRDTEKARMALYALRPKFKSMPPLAVSLLLDTVNKGRLSVAKEVVRQLGELRLPSGDVTLCEMFEAEKCHEDLRKAIVTALLHYASSHEIWDFYKEACIKYEWRVALKIVAIKMKTLPLGSIEAFTQILLTCLMSPMALLFAGVLAVLEKQRSALSDKDTETAWKYLVKEYLDSSDFSKCAAIAPVLTKMSSTNFNKEYLTRSLIENVRQGADLAEEKMNKIKLEYVWNKKMPNYLLNELRDDPRFFRLFTKCFQIAGENPGERLKNEYADLIVIALADKRNHAYQELTDCSYPVDDHHHKAESWFAMQVLRASSHRLNQHFYSANGAAVNNILQSVDHPVQLEALKKHFENTYAATRAWAFP